MNKMIIIRQTTYSLNDINIDITLSMIYICCLLSKNTTEKYSLNSTDKRGNEHGEITTADT